MGSIHPSQEELTNRKIVGVNPETVTNIASTDFPGHWPGEDHVWDLEKFRQTFKVRIHQNAAYESSFSLLNLDAALANALRRILLADLPSLAIDKVRSYKNTSILADEVLAHRLGLIPLRGNMAAIDRMEFWKRPDEETDEEGSTEDDINTVKLKLAVKCTRNEEAIARGETDPRTKYNNAHVYASQIEWVPSESQRQLLGGDVAPEPVNPDILITKMRPGQELYLELAAHVMTGRDHAKFSPVATATYRLMPTIDIRQPILGADAQKFQKCFPEGVIGLGKVTAQEARQKDSGYEGHEGEDKAYVEDSFGDTVTRECLRHDEFKDKVKLGRIRDHFIFNVESTGQSLSSDLFLDSILVLKMKAQVLKEEFTTRYTT
ncbi:MAG: hypothetical protein Q9227_009146 [Pyrenula ochraceoflavens]